MVLNCNPCYYSGLGGLFGIAYGTVKDDRLEPLGL